MSYNISEDDSNIFSLPCTDSYVTIEYKGPREVTIPKLNTVGVDNRRGLGSRCREIFMYISGNLILPPPPAVVVTGYGVMATGPGLTRLQIKKKEDMTADKEVKDIIAAHDIVVFALATCPYCKAAKEALTADGKKFETVVVNDALTSALHKLTGQESFPSIWVKGKYVGGCNDGPEDWMGIKPLIKNGKLEEMLKA